MWSLQITIIKCNRDIYISHGIIEEGSFKKIIQITFKYIKATEITL